ncbi:MFS general substrate transporter [Hypoxylon cercidicola]|nr:MFS general substrate transporter [Hypoxylon cercidicola]
MSAPLPLSLPLREVAPKPEEAMSSIGDVATIDEAVAPPNREESSPVVLPEDFRTLIKPADCGDKLAMKWSTSAKWTTLSIIFLVQVSMNLNTTLYSNGIGAISYEYNVSQFAVRWGGAASFLIAYAFGCELWAPWSEEYGRKWVLQTSLFLVNCFAILVATAPTWTAHVVGRTLGGLSSAGGSVTLAVVSDLFQNDDPMFQHATSFIVLSSVGGSIIGPIIGGFIEEYCPWRWCVWFQLIFGFVVQVLHLVFVKETRSTVVMDKVAKGRRESGQNPHLFGPNEMSGKGHIDWAEVGQIWLRPFGMFLTEPIVLCFSLLSGFSDALIFMMVQSFGFVYWQWGFGPIELGLAFIPIGIGYLIAYGAFFLFIKRNVNMRKRRPESEYEQYESRLWLLLFLAPLLPIGLLLFAFTSAWFSSPIHWIASMFASCLIGVANFAIYMATIDYVLRSYGPYAASATGGNGWARDFLAGILTPYAIPMVTCNRYEKLSIFLATILLFSIAAVLYGAVLVVYFKGPWLRQRSKFAQTLAQAAVDQDNAASAHDEDSGLVETSNVNGLLHFLTSENMPGSRAASSAGSTPTNSARNSLHVPRPPVSRQPTETSHLERPPVGQRQHSNLSVFQSPLQHEITVAAVRSERRCGCDGAVAACGCGNKDTRETQRSSGPTSVREVEDAQQPSSGHVHFRDPGANEVRGQEREKVDNDPAHRCVVA